MKLYQQMLYCMLADKKPKQVVSLVGAARAQWYHIDVKGGK